MPDNSLFREAFENSQNRWEQMETDTTHSSLILSEINKPFSIIYVYEKKPANHYSDNRMLRQCVSQKLRGIYDRGYMVYER